MKELDVLLERFIADQQSEIEQGMWPELESLLAFEDDQLWDFVQHPEAASTQYRKLLQRICHGSINTH
jgi:succinate dehydrogenase flavin-adding protein (antitoxin of CptAB toxin-antitoxin module)